MKSIFAVLVSLLCLQSCFSQNDSKKETKMENKNNPAYSRTDNSKVVLKDEEWKNILSPEVYNIARQKGTERPYTSKFESFKEASLKLSNLSLIHI